MVIGEFGSQKPMDVRNAFYQVFYEEVLRAKDAGLPAAGECSCVQHCKTPHLSQWASILMLLIKPSTFLFQATSCLMQPYSLGVI